LASWLPHAQLDAPLENILRDKDRLFSNRLAQPLVLMATLLAWQGLKEAVPAPALVCGYSLGELSAYAVAGALTCEDAIELAVQRAHLMDECARRTSPQTMLAVSGLDRTSVLGMVQEQALFIAIETGTTSFIVGGLACAAAEFAANAMERGGVVGELPVAVASHTPFMTMAAKTFLLTLQQRRFVDPYCPVLAGIYASPIRDAAAAKAALCSQIEQEIRWADCMDACAESGIGIALELGPGCALSRMLQARHPHIECRSVGDFRSLAGLASWILRR